MKPAALDPEDHHSLVLWAAECAKRTLGHFERRYPNDYRPRKAIEAGLAWTRGEITVNVARDAAFAAHVAAREADQAGNAAACAAARAAGHVAAASQTVVHARHAGNYAVTAATYGTEADNAAGGSADSLSERDWQIQRLPEHLRSLMIPTYGMTRKNH